MGLLDVVDLPEDERPVDPWPRGQPDLDASAAEGGEVLSNEGRLLRQCCFPCRHTGAEVGGREDDVGESVNRTALMLHRGSFL